MMVVFSVIQFFNNFHPRIDIDRMLLQKPRWLGRPSGRCWTGFLKASGPRIHHASYFFLLFFHANFFTFVHPCFQEFDLLRGRHVLFFLFVLLLLLLLLLSVSRRLLL